jgi:hypothetical protein
MRRSRGAHPFRISAKQRLHLATLLILFTLPLQAQSDIEFDPAITQEEFATFSRYVSQAIYATPVEPARARGLLGFDIGIAVTALPVDPEAAYWTRAVTEDFTVSDYVAVPRIIVSKGFSVATLSATYSKVPDTDISVWGGALDLPIVRGGLAAPTLALRGAYAQLRGVDELDLKTYGAELFLSKAFGPVTPYAAAGMTRSVSEGRVISNETLLATLSDEKDGERYTLGLRISLLVPKLAIEATQAETRSYAAKLSFGW